jgi:hypothetical protein
MGARRADIGFAGVMFSVVFLSSCHKASAPAPTPAPTPPAASQPAAAAVPADPDATDSMFDTKANPNAAVGAFLDPGKLSATECKFGVAPKRDPRVQYANDVILMEQGDRAIKSVGGDGMTWTFDASAPQVSEFSEGKIVFATGRAVGRIAQLRINGGEVTVKLAPVQINEVVQNGHFIIDSDFDPKQMITYEAPDFPGFLNLKAAEAKTSTLNPWLDEPSRFQYAQFIPTAEQLPSGLGQLQVPSLTPAPLNTTAPTISVSDFTVHPIIGSDASIGLAYDYDKSALHVHAMGKLALNSAHMKFALDIQNFKIVTFGMQLDGASSIILSLQSWTDKEALVNADAVVVPPVDFSLPIPVAGLPLALTIHTAFRLQSQFRAKQSILTASGEYTTSGSLFIGVKNGVKQPLRPLSDTKAKVQLADSIQGVSVGINSMLVTFAVKPMVGIGAFGFNTGVYVSITFNGSVIKQSDIAPPRCRAGYMNGRIDSGVGYQLPAAFVKIINGVLSVFTRYRIEGSGILIPGPDGEFMNLPAEVPTGCLSGKTA